MQFRRIEQEEWRDLQSTAYAHEEIRKRVAKLVDWLATYFNDRTVGNVSGLKFEPSTEPDLACEITTPCGSARLLLDWTMHDRNLHGVLFLERKRRDQHGLACWEKVWRLYVPERDRVFIESPSDGFQLRNGSGRRLEDEVFEIGMSVFFAVVSGPAVK